MSQQLLEKVEALRAVLVARATGGFALEEVYIPLRAEIIAIQRIEHVLPPFVRTCRNLSDFWSFIKPEFSTYETRREYLRNQFDPLLSMLEMEGQAPSDASTSAVVRVVDSDYVREAWMKAIDRRATDSEGAITAARTLLESVCKHILDTIGEKYNDEADLPKLYALTANALTLSPSQHTEQIFKQILGGCQSVVGGLGAMRNKHGDAHGVRRTNAKPAPRHAELAVNLSGAMATFLLQTWEARKI